VAFVESAPKDWFEFTNQSDCELKDIELTIDLSASAGKLIFDTTETGEGVEVFQPFEVREGSITLAGSVGDGDRSLAIAIGSLLPGQSASFTIDVDDTLKNSELGMIRVSDSEIVGGQVVLKTTNGNTANGTFDNTGKLELQSPQCS